MAVKKISLRGSSIQRRIELTHAPGDVDDQKDLGCGFHEFHKRPQAKRQRNPRPRFSEYGVTVLAFVLAIGRLAHDCFRKANNCLFLQDRFHLFWSLSDLLKLQCKQQLKRLLASVVYRLTAAWVRQPRHPNVAEMPQPSAGRRHILWPAFHYLSH